jgi:hypothetical protein
MEIGNLTEKYYKEYKGKTTQFEKRKTIEKARKMLNTHSFLIFLENCINFTQNKINENEIELSVIDHKLKQSTLNNKN